MEILLIRHAQPAWVVDGKSVLDPALTELGHAQARYLAAAAPEWKRPPTEIWVSDATRARQTAAPLAQALDIPVIERPWLTEIRLNPAWEGENAQGLRPIFMKLKTRSEPEWWDGVPGGESFRDFHDRIRSNLYPTLAEYGVRHLDGPHFEVDDPERRVAIVAHGGTNSVLTSELLGLPIVPWSWERMVLAHAAFTRLKSTRIADSFVFGMREHSDAGHIPADQRSR